MPCLCCEREMPIQSQKVCPLCGKVFQGIGWWGIDAHWRSRHENEMPYEQFRDGLCEAHRSTGNTEESPASRSEPSDSQEPACRMEPQIRQELLALRSSHIENVLIHALVASLAQAAWKRDPWMDFQVFNSEVDDAGFDLALSSGGNMRFIQVKQTHAESTTAKWSLRVDFSKMPGACAVVVVFKAETLEIDHCLYFGGAPGEPMPSIEEGQATLSPGRRNAQGERKVREHYRDVPKRRFEGPFTTEELLERLFPASE